MRNIRVINEKNEIKNVLSENICNSTEIRIATGYFSYLIFEIFKNEFEELIINNGKFRLVIGQDTNLSNLQFFEKMSSFSKEEFLEKLFDNYFSDFNYLSDETLKCVYKMLNGNIVQVKVGVSNDGGIFHVKEYLFENKHKRSYIMGSLNFTHKAIISNHESINYVVDDKSYYDNRDMFDSRWNNINNCVTTLEINEYLAFKVKNELTDRAVKDGKKAVELREYQKEAIDLLIENNFNGFLEMATGTGKTFTALLGLDRYLSENSKKYFTLIMVPLQHLVSQWRKELEVVFGYNIKIIECFGAVNWKSSFSLNVDLSEKENTFCIMVQDSFFNNAKEIYDLTKYSNNILVIDEAHNLTKKCLEVLDDIPSSFSSRVGLSATPQNYLDEERTRLLFSFFKGAHYKFELKRAIDDGYLTKYKYVPIIVELDLDEEREYKRISNLIRAEKNFLKKERLLDERSDVLSKAKNKMNELIRVVDSLDDLQYTLIYCNPGKFLSDDNITRRYIDQISIDLEENTKLKPKKKRITHEESITERNKIVNEFENEKLDVILAIKCLDEGYNIPAVRNAFILHSTRNPSEFIQRRGRVLRKFKGKEMAYIYDFIVRVNGEVPDDEKNRFIEYYELSNNIDELKYFKNKYIGDYEYE